MGVHTRSMPVATFVASPGRWWRAISSARLALFGAMVALALFRPSAAQAQAYAIGQKVECDASDLNKYYKPGTIVAFHPGETFNGEKAGSGYFFRVRFEDPAFGEALCKVTSLRPSHVAQGAAAAARPAVGGDVVFGVRAPVPCPAPIRTRPNMPQIRALVQCRLEGRQGSLMYLVANLTIEAGATRPYNYNADSFNSGIDPAAPVLPLRGGYLHYQCSPTAENPPGRNCTTDPEPHAAGECYRTTFGDWQCNMQGNDNDLSQRRFHQPPPR